MMKTSEAVKIDKMPTERIAMITWLLARGNSYTVAEVAAMAGVTHDGAYKLLCKISRILPIYCDGRVWKSL